VETGRANASTEENVEGVSTWNKKKKLGSVRNQTKKKIVEYCAVEVTLCEVRPPGCSWTGTWLKME